MTDFQTYQTLPADEREWLGFTQYRIQQQITTHGPGCFAWGRGHYDCALQEIVRARSTKSTVEG